MTVVLRRYAGIVLLAAALVVLATVGQAGGSFGSEFLWPPVYSINRIAVVGPDAQIRSYLPDGTGEMPISEGEGLFTWPTWSPDGKTVAFSGIVRSADGEPVVTLFGYDWAEGDVHPIHEGEPGYAGLLADGVVHYPLWSPDSSKLAFVAVTELHGLSLFVDDVAAASEPAFVLDRGPLWMSWSTDSSRLAVHRSVDHFLVSFEDDIRMDQVRLESDSYRVPAWRPNLSELALSSPAGPQSYGLYSAAITDAGLVLTQPVSEVGPASAFLWSPDGSHLAVADDVRPIRYGSTPILVYRRFRMLDTTTFSDKALVYDNVLSYFWSPDGTKVALVTIADTGGELRWTLLDAATGSTTRLVDFTPSRDQLTMFQFFDQYAYSHLLWSPDSRFLIFSGRLSFSASSAGFMAQSDRRGSKVYLIDTGPVTTIDEVAAGVLCFWSPV